MRAMVIEAPAAIESNPLRAAEIEKPRPGPGEILVRVSVCGVCRTDLHVAEGDLPPKHPRIVPGHEVVGVVDAAGAGCQRFAIGTRVGIAWLRETCGICPECRRDRENLCRNARFTGWDADGGYAQWAIVREDFAHPIPDTLADQEVAPLLCAGIIGYRALRRTELPRGGRLGIYGFGASAHLAAQVALAEGATVHVLTRSAPARALALELGAASAGGAADPAPEPLDAAILFAPVGELVPVALAALDRGGTLAVAGIHLTDIPALNYQRYLFQERTLRSVTANTRHDGVEFLEIAARIGLRVVVSRYSMSQADRALADLAADRVNGAAVLIDD